MKTKQINKKGVKKSLNSASIIISPKNKFKKETKTKKNKKGLKKAKIADSIQNGNPTFDNKKTIVKKLDKHKKKGNKKTKQHNSNIAPKTKANVNTVKKTSPIVESEQEDLTKSQKKKLTLLKRKQLTRELRKAMRKERGQYNVSSIKLSVEQIKERITNIKGRQVLSKTAKRKLSVLQKKLRIEELTDKSRNTTNDRGSKKKNKKQVGASVKIKQDVNNTNKTKAIKKNAKDIQEVKSEEVDQYDNNIEDNDEMKSSIEEEVIDRAEKSVNIKNNGDNANKGKKVKTADVKKKQKKEAADKSLDDKKGDAKKKRYVLFVGNLPFNTTVDEIKQHFLTKVSAVTSVRIPTEIGMKTPRGIAYVEVANNIDYEKGLSLHHTFVNKRRINVQYSAHGSKAGKKTDVVAKNKKLQALRQAGKLADQGKKNKKKSLKKRK